jgi:tetratricopeptide (TPR) repeat protein
MLLGLLAAVSGFFLWNRISLSPAETPKAGQSAKPPASDGRRAIGLDDVSLEAHPQRVVDAANRLGGFRDILADMTQGFMEDLGIDLHVVTLSDPEAAIEELADAVFAQRKIGREAPTGGMLIVLNAARSEARIGVSYALEGAFTDGFLGSLARLQLAPYASYTFSGMAVMDVVMMLKDAAYIQAMRGNLELAPDYRQRQAYLDAAEFLSGGAGAQTRIAEIPADLDLKAAVPPELRGRYAPSKDPAKSVEAYVRVLSDWAGDPTLELFTPGSRMMRKGYPFAPFEAMRRAEKLEASRPWRIEVEGDRAVALSDNAARGFVPVPMHRIEGTWRIDLVETWKNLFTGDGRDPVLMNANTPYYFAYRELGTADFRDMAAWELGDHDLEDVVAKLEAATEGSHAALAHFLLAELLWRNCFLSMDAFAHYEEAVKLAPSAPLFSETLGDRASYVGFKELAVVSYSRLKSRGWLKLAAAYERSGDTKRAINTLKMELERDPFEVDALRELEPLLRSTGHGAEANEVAEALADLESGSGLRAAPVVVEFEPAHPLLNTSEPTLVGKTVVYDHSEFSLTLRNSTEQPIEVDQFKVLTHGTENATGLGEIKDWLVFPRQDHILNPGESAVVDHRTWGFVIDTKHDQLRYIVDYCWKAVEQDVRRCRFAWADVFPP